MLDLGGKTKTGEAHNAFPVYFMQSEVVTVSWRMRIAELQVPRGWRQFIGLGLMPPKPCDVALSGSGHFRALLSRGIARATM